MVLTEKSWETLFTNKPYASYSKYNKINVHPFLSNEASNPMPLPKRFTVFLNKICMNESKKLQKLNRPVSRIKVPGWQQEAIQEETIVKNTNDFSPILS